MSFEYEGWLGEEAQVMRRYCETHFASNLAAARHTNSLAHKILRGLEVDACNSQHILAGALFARLLQSAQAAVHLVSLGLRHDAAAIIRVSIEALILLKNSCRDPAFGRDYVARGSRETLRSTERGLPTAVRDELEANLRVRLEVAEAQHRQIVEKLGEGFGNLKELAANVGLSELYNTYRLYSASVHCEAGTVASYYERQSGALVMHYKPEWQYTVVYLFEICDLLLRAIESLEELFGDHNSEAREAIVRELKELSPQWPDPKRKGV